MECNTSSCSLLFGVKAIMDEKMNNALSIPSHTIS